MDQEEIELLMEKVMEYPEADNGYPLVPQEDVIGVFPRDTMWGNRITFDTYEERKVHGHISPRVRNGDLFAYQLESGRIGVFMLIEVDHALDPSDMFFANARDVGYLRGYSEPGSDRWGPRS